MFLVCGGGCVANSGDFVECSARSEGATSRLADAEQIQITSRPPCSIKQAVVHPALSLSWILQHIHNKFPLLLEVHTRTWREWSAPLRWTQLIVNWTLCHSPPAMWWTWRVKLPPCYEWLFSLVVNLPTEWFMILFINFEKYWQIPSNAQSYALHRRQIKMNDASSLPLTRKLS